jgi:hypothetical protein
MSMKLPMREKYVDQKVGIWIVFGEHPDGTVDVNDGMQDVFEGIPKEAALKVIAAHDEFREKLYEILTK